eukprot:Sspe_Gene.115145::Locus_102077_Transcript_1_1_Confidence_1.000_Length_488::g.115145::m.115145
MEEWRVERGEWTLHSPVSALHSILESGVAGRESVEKGESTNLNFFSISISVSTFWATSLLPPLPPVKPWCSCLMVGVLSLVMSPCPLHVMSPSPRFWKEYHPASPVTIHYLYSSDSDFIAASITHWILCHSCVTICVYVYVCVCVC